MSEIPSDLPRDRASNLRPAPFALTPQTVSQLIGEDALATVKMVHVPLLPIKLVNMPRRSEDPRLAKANDDAGMNLIATPESIRGGTPNRFRGPYFAAIAADIANSAPVMSTYAAPEFDCLSDDGQQWIIAIVRETIRRCQEGSL